MAPTVQTDPASAQRAGALLARAFHDDAMFCAVQPDPDRRRRVLPWFFAAAARLGLREGELHMLDEDAGAAIWLPPGNGRMRAGPIVRSGLAQVPFRFGPSAFRRFARITGNFDSVREEVVHQPYWHLFILGVEPGHQRRGLGGELIAPVLARADDVGQPCYLETSEEHNVPFYERHGFAVAGGRRDPDGLPPFWPMLREAGGS
ncbi:MAG: GNAT family N-acetyltransferase [Thermoleophilaceae bacterium]|nr:GNAT family N-acetyltransferase [Thermoleophilaceae bacterium]